MAEWPTKTVVRQTVFRLPDGLTLDALRDIVAETEHIENADVKVEVVNHYGQRDQNEGCTVTVHGA